MSKCVRVRVGLKLTFCRILGDVNDMPISSKAQRAEVPIMAPYPVNHQAGSSEFEEL